MKPVALALDDDELIRKMMERVLDQLGFQPYVVDTVDKFWKVKSEVSPDLYLIDLRIGADSGIDVVQQLRATNGDVPVLVISGDHGDAVVAHALELGANDFLRKPFSKTLLAGKLGKLVRTSEIEDSERLIEQDDRATAPAKVLFDAKILGVDELGLTLWSPHLVPKGSVVRVGGEFVHELGGTPDCLICVTSTALRAGGGYDLQAEFETTSAEFLQSVRRWLAKAKAA
jgi:FixJ family two-component response regulator